MDKILVTVHTGWIPKHRVQVFPSACKTYKTCLWLLYPTMLLAVDSMVQYPILGTWASNTDQIILRLIDVWIYQQGRYQGVKMSSKREITRDL
ncbi:MAG TPA: hypothetical protein VJ201_07980 [Candidatus Babeliales bacterium]|nr:hypothetical protein [Candidatus Babeliales bacterium]